MAKFGDLVGVFLGGEILKVKIQFPEYQLATGNTKLLSFVDFMCALRNYIFAIVLSGKIYVFFKGPISFLNFYEAEAASVIPIENTS